MPRLRSAKDAQVEEVGVRIPIAQLVVVGGLAAVPRVRASVAAALARHSDDVADDAALVATELVTNPVLHGGPDVRVRLRLLSEAVRLEVEDDGSGLPVTGQRSTVGTTGRGLVLVAALLAA